MPGLKFGCVQVQKGIKSMEAAAHNSQVCQLAMLPHTLGSQMLLSCLLRTASPGGNPQLFGWMLKGTRISEKRGGTELNLNKKCTALI